MAGMATVLTEFADNGNSRTYTFTGHTVLSPKLVLQKRKVPVGNAIMQEDTITVLLGTTDSDGAVLPQRVSFQAQIRRPITGDADDVTAALAVFRDIIAGDEFGVTVNTSNWLT